MMEKTLYYFYILFIVLTACMVTSNAGSDISFYNYGIQEKNIDYIIKDNKCLINVDSLHNKIAGIKVKKSWNLISMTRGKKFIMIGKKSSIIYVYGNENGVSMDFITQKLKGKYYVQLSKICEALDIQWKYSNKKGIQKFEIEDGGY